MAHERSVPGVAGKRVVISGASRGLGRAFALALAGQGARLVINGTNESALLETVAMIDAVGAEVTPVVGAIDEPDTAARMVGASQSAFGGIDMAIANAAVNESKPFLTSAVQDLDRTVAVNIRGTWLLCREAAAVMGHGGQLLIVTAAAGFTRSTGLTSYAATKAAGLGLMCALAEEFEPLGIRVNAFGPTAVTDMSRPSLSAIADRYAAQGVEPPEPRELGFGTPEDVAKVVVYLASDASSHLHNQLIRFNGSRLSLWRLAQEAVAVTRDRWELEDLAEHFPDPVNSIAEVPAQARV